MKKSEYPPPPWKLRHMWLGNREFWEVVPGFFIGATDFVTATNRFIEGGISASLDKLIALYGPIVSEGTPPLRDFTGDYFEVVHGWVVWAHSREEAQRDFDRSPGVGSYGSRLTLALDRGAKATGVVQESTPQPAEAPAQKDASVVEDAPMNRYVDKDNSIWWEIVPGRVICEPTKFLARERFGKEGVRDTWSREAATKTYGLKPAPEDKPEPVRRRLRRFKDSEGDQWFLTEEPVTLYCTNDEQEAREDAADGGDPVAQIVERWGPLRELDADNNVIATFTDPHELLGYAKPDDVDSEPESITTNEETPTMTTARQAPPFLHYMEDQDGRNWFEVHQNCWVLTDSSESTEEQAQDAWRRFEARGADPDTYGRPTSDIQSAYGPLKEKGFVELKPKPRPFTQDELRGGVLSTSDRCTCFKKEDEDEELAMRMRVGGNTFCVTCGKLRP